MNICSPIPKHCAPFSDNSRVHNMFAIDCNKSSVNFTGSDVLRLQKPNHASHLAVGGSWYQRVHCLNLSHSQRGKVCSMNCTRQLSTLYWTHHMTHQLKLKICAGCMRKRSLLSRCPTYYTRSSSDTFQFWLSHHPGDKLQGLYRKRRLNNPKIVHNALHCISLKMAKSKSKHSRGSMI